MNDNEIINIIDNSEYKNFRLSVYYKIFNDEQIEYLKHRFSNFKSFTETVYRIKHKIEQQPVCPICGKELKFNKGYAKTCSYSCQNKLRNSINTLNNRVLEIYGVSNVWQSDEIKNKCKQKWLEKYGVDNVSKSLEIKNQKRETCLKHFGVKAGFNNGKAEITKLLKYNSSTYNNMDKNRQTCLAKYGEDSIFKVKEFKDKIKQTFKTKYGVDCAAQLPQTIKNSHSPEAIQKCFETQKRSKTINTSKLEQKSYELLKSVFNDVIYQYKDERYPFYCDFYIPSLDLFIECQYAMFHNGRPYVGNEKDLQEIELLKEKSKKRKQITNKKTRYDSVIEIWSIHDVRKRNTAKENKLNYKEFFTILDLENWLNKYETTK